MSSSNHAHNARDLPDAEASRDLAAAEKKAAREKAASQQEAQDDNK